MLERCFAYHIKNNLFLSGQKVSIKVFHAEFYLVALQLARFNIIFCGKYADFQARKCLDILKLNLVEHMEPQKKFQ